MRLVGLLTGSSSRRNVQFTAIYETPLCWLITLSLVATWILMYRLQRLDVTDPKLLRDLEISARKRKPDLAAHKAIQDFQDHLLSDDKEKIEISYKRAKKSYDKIAERQFNKYPEVSADKMLKHNPIDLMYAMAKMHKAGEMDKMPLVPGVGEMYQTVSDNKTKHFNADLRQLLLRIWHQILEKQVRPKDSVYKINVSLSDRTSFDRDNGDARPYDCPAVYDHNLLKDLPRATVIIPFYNEALSMILRTVHSVLNHSPPVALSSIILVDDGSTNSNLNEDLNYYIKFLPKVRLIRNKRRQGLMRARMIGAHEATSDIIVFQDAHTECTVGWLEPLLIYLKDHPKSIVQPDIDEINPDKLTYWIRNDFRNPTEDFQHSLILRGGFNWDLRFAWIPLSREELHSRKSASEPYSTYTLVGCSFAVNKQYFLDIGGFDEDMNIWGGENIEIGFRTWMCGGSMMTIPCSHVGHVFKPFSYSFDGNKEKIVGGNLMRTAEIWMDDYKKYFFASWRAFPFKRSRLTREDRRSVKERKSQTRDRMTCKDFHWYMTNVAKGMNIPPADAVLFGEIYNSQSDGCMQVLQSGYIGIHYECFPTRLLPFHEFYLTQNGQLKWTQNDSKCIIIEDQTTALLKLDECPKENAPIWMLTGEITYGHLMVTIVNREEEEVVMCVQQITSTEGPHKDEQLVQLAHCDMRERWQQWWFQYKFDYNA